MSKTNLLEMMIEQTKQTKKNTQKQQKIVEVSLKLFSEKGYANTSTKEIAIAAEVAEGTIFRHYGSKENLLLSLILPFIKDFIPSMADDVFNEIMSKKIDHFEDFLRELIKNRLAFFKENRELFQILIKELLYNDELKNSLLPILAEHIYKKITVVIDMFKEKGEFDEVSSKEIQTMVLTFLGGYFVSNLVLNTVGDEEDVESAIKFIMHGISKKNREN